MKFTCIIIDDEPLAHEVLESYINQGERLQLTGKFYNATDAGNFLKSNSVDILFLDIEMPEMNGLDFLQSLQEKPITILTTAYRDYALEGFELGVMDYLLKPIAMGRFTSAVDRVIEFLQLKKLEAHVFPDTTTDSKNITIKTGTKTLSIPICSITHIQGLKDYSIVYTDDNKKYVIKGYLKVIGKIFDERNFVRVHKSFIMARNCIKNINQDKIEVGGYIIPVGRVFKNDVMSVLRSH